MTEVASAPEPSPDPPKKLSMEELYAELEELSARTILQDGTEAAEAHVMLYPRQMIALKQLSSLLLLAIPKKELLALLLSGRNEDLIKALRSK